VAGTVNQTIGACGGLHADAGGGRLKQRRILVVEDNELNRELLRDWLEVEGYEVWLAADLTTSYEVFAQQVPDAVLLDINLGNENGLDFQGLREQLNHWLQERTVSS
jgi:CheY-like chemotaxis protein